MSKLKIIFNYNNTKEQEPVELGEWLQVQKNQDDIYNMRCLYVLRANADQELVKFGIGGTEGSTGCYGRLRQYVISYGVEEVGFSCKGVKLFLLVGTKYNPTVELKESFVFRKELQLKREFKGDNLPGRGIERVTTNLAKLYQIIFDSSTMSSLEKETKLRRSLRIDQSKVIDTDYVLNILGHTTPQKGTTKTTYLLEWTRPYEDEYTNQKTKKKEAKLYFKTNEPGKKIKDYPNGEVTLRRYQVAQKAMDPKVVFRD